MKKRFRLRRSVLGAICLEMAFLANGARAPVFGQSSALAACTRELYRGDYKQAASLAERHLLKHPKDNSVRVILARAELAQGQFPPAFEDLRKVLASDPRNMDALYYMSLLSRELSQREYQRLFALAPDSDRVHQLLGEAALAAENPTQAEAEFQKAIEANPNSVEGLTELADLKRSQSKFDEAVVYYARAEQINPQNYEAAYGLGASYTYKQDYASAITWMRKAVVSAPDSGAGHFGLGNALYQNGEFEAAIPELQTALRLEPRMKQAYFLLGRTYSRLGRDEEAKAAFQKLDELNRAEVPGHQEDTGAGFPKPEMPK